MPSFYYPDLNSTQKRISLIGDEYHHLTRVLRCRVGDIVKLNSGKGWIGSGEVISVTKSQAILDVINASYYQKDNKYAIAFSLLRNKNDEWLVEKVTELGVSDLFPMTTQYSVRNPSKNTSGKFQQVALSAIKQCDNPWLPDIHPVQSLEVSINNILKGGYIPVIASENRPDVWINTLDYNNSYCFIIGPEGGFSADEFLMFTAMKFNEVSISKLILRAETAAISIVSQYLLHVYSLHNTFTT